MNARPLTRQRGGETVEFTLFTLPVLLLLLFAFVEFGFAFADRAVITDASRAAAREAIRGGTDHDKAACDAADRVLQSARTWGTSLAYSCTGAPCDAACDINRDASTNPADPEPGEPITVTLTFPFQFRVLPFLSDVTNVQLSGVTVMRTLPH